MLQIRVSTPDFSRGIAFKNSIILERADNISLTKTLSSSDETIQFEIPVNDPKAQQITYKMFWEAWDTETGERLNFGPIEEIQSSTSQVLSIRGHGRSAIFMDYYKSVQTFYYPIDQFIDDLRFENVAVEPRASTHINKTTDSDYYGLSKRSKDYAIDEQTGYISFGRDVPNQDTIKTDQYWSGVDKGDVLDIDLGDTFYIAKSRVLLPWWGGPTINNNRAYDWSLKYSADKVSYDTGPSFATAFATDVPSYALMNPSFNGKTIYFEGDGFEADQVVIASGLAPILARHWMIDITNTHAWYGSVFDGTKSDEWDWECGESNMFEGEHKESPTISGGVIDKIDLTPAGDCHASVVEVGLFKQIVGRDTISKIAYHQIDGNSRQITFTHTPAASEMITAGSGKKFEPGSFFRKITATGVTGKVKDEYNDILADDGDLPDKLPAYARLLRFADAGAQVTSADCWLAKTDAYSYGASYNYTTIVGDTAVLHFRGVSLKWYATIPSGKTPGHVLIELRSNTTGTWSGWSTLEADFALPANVSGHKVWEITLESGTLVDNTIYELRLTVLSGFVSIDSFAGFWSATFTDYNEDNARTRVRVPNEATQLYNGKYSGGSMYQFKAGKGFTKMSLAFVGDRAVVYSHTGKNWGKIKIALIDSTGAVYPIPGGESDGSLIYDLNSKYSISQVVVFDSDEYFTSPGLPWGSWTIAVYMPKDDTGPIAVDGFGVHETSGLSVKFVNTAYLDILKNTAEALQMEWDITEKGIKIVPRIGTDTKELFTEGRGTTINIDEVDDITKVASQLLVTGADIDGLPLFAIIEDKKNRAILGRTVQRPYELRNVGEYFTLIGAGRAELMRRSVPEKRITISRSNDCPVSIGDSFMVKGRFTQQKYRVTTITRTQAAAGGTAWTLECVTWPQLD